ncbi:MAG: type II toxin-antitoxin system RelE/ParE family toxin [Hydrogenophaga sp.]|nr:type II toxin-antitoxin system RelE/ParE family toxin [Hydrogenophaga sp.]
MTGYRLRPSAEADMDAIWEYTCRSWSADQADRYIDDLFDAFELLGEAPGLGQEAFAVAAGYRRLRVGHHLVFYRSAGVGAVDIVRVLHEKSDVASRLGKV